MAETINPKPDSQLDQIRFITPKEKEELAVIECSYVWHIIARHGQKNPEINNEI